jgi:hypothetical protein
MSLVSPGRQMEQLTLTTKKQLYHYMLRPVQVDKPRKKIARYFAGFSTL